MSNPTSTEPDVAKLDNLKLSSDPKSNGTNPGAASFAPKAAGWKWSDEGDENTSASDATAGTAAGTGAETTAPGVASEKNAGESSKSDQSDSGPSQTDGATAFQHGSVGLDEPEFDVNVKLADLQDDPNNPLYSVKSFEQLNL